MTRPAWDRPLRGDQANGWVRKAKHDRVLERDAGVCHVCGKPGATEVDHVVPRAEGGGDDEANLAPIHPRPCHVRKTAAEAARGRERNGRRRPQPAHPGMLR